MTALVYGLLWILARAVGRLFFRYRTVGTVPATGGLLIAANHTSYLDIPFLGCGMKRRAWFLGRSDLFPFPIVNGVLQSLGWIPLRLGRVDREAFAKAIGLIKEGRVVVIFPEGSRSLDGNLRFPKPGIGMIVSQTGCPVVPAYIKGTYEALPPGAWLPRLHPVTVTYGAPIDFSGALKASEGKELYRQVSHAVMARIAEIGNVAAPTGRSTPAGGMADSQEHRRSLQR